MPSNKYITVTDVLRTELRMWMHGWNRSSAHDLTSIKTALNGVKIDLCAELAGEN